MKYKVGAAIFTFLGIILFSGSITSINSKAQGAPPLILITLLFLGLAVFNIICIVKSVQTGYVDKLTGKKIRFNTTVSTKGILVDEANKLWQTRFTAVPRIYHFSDLKSFEIIKDRSNTSTYNSNRSSFAGTAAYGSRRTTSTQISYLSLEIKLVNMQRLRWVVKLTNPHQAMADVEDTAELLQYIKDNQ